MDDVTIKEPLDEVLDETVEEVEEMVNLEDENWADPTGFEQRLNQIKYKLGFNPKDIQFWFTTFEAELEGVGIKSQWTKRQALARVLPEEATHVVKWLLNKNKD